MTHIHVQPARPGLRVPTGLRPGEYFPEEPTMVLRDRHIDRRLADGDLIEAAVPADPAPEAQSRKRGSQE